MKILHEHGARDGFVSDTEASNHFNPNSEPQNLLSEPPPQMLSAKPSEISTTTEELKQVRIHLFNSFELQLLSKSIARLSICDSPQNNTISSTSQSAPSQDQPKQKLTLHNVFRLLLPLMREWLIIGELLGINDRTLREIEHAKRSNNERLHDVILEWLKQTNPHPTWEVLAEKMERLNPSKAGR